MTKIAKNRKTVVIALLFLLTVATATLLGTLGRYVTSSTVSDEAVAAEFGLNIPNTIDLFSESYTNVQANEEGKKIIAPGTSGQYKFAVTGKSEVAYQVEASIAIEYSSEWNGYAPLEFSINGTDWTDNLDDFKTSLRNALDSEIMEPNAEYANAQTIYWRWPFHVSAENDIKDTQIGISAAQGTAPNVSVELEIKAIQID